MAGEGREEGPPQLPIGDRGYLACRQCRLILTEAQFLRDGCSVCETGPISREDLLDVATAEFSNFVGLIAPEKSWVARLIGRANCPNGVFAAAIADDDEEEEDVATDDADNDDDDDDDDNLRDSSSAKLPFAMTDDELFASVGKTHRRKHSNNSNYTKEGENKEGRMAGVHSPALLPSEFRQQTPNDLPPGVKDSKAYDELLANYATLKARVNSMLAAGVDSIRHNSVVDLSGNYIGAVGLQVITTLLAKNEGLEELLLPGNGLNNDSVVFFCKALLRHPRLARLDLSRNDISLSAGLALLSLAQQNVKLVFVGLSDTQVPHAVLRKIAQCIGRNNTLIAKTVSMRANTATSTVSEGKTNGSKRIGKGKTEAVIGEKNDDDAVAVVHQGSSGVFSSTVRETVRKAEWANRENEALERLASVVQTSAASHARYVPLLEIESGWRFIEVAILAPPFLFESEKELLVNQVFRRLNEELVSHKVYLILPADSPDEPAGTYLRDLRFTVAADVLRSVENSRFLTIELIGDRAGEYQQLSANEMMKRPILWQSMRQRRGSTETVPAESLGAPPLFPVLYTAHQRAEANSSWLIIATRKDTRKIGVPPSLAPLLTEEPPVEHPDHLQPLVKRTVAVDSLTLCGFQRIKCDTGVKEMKWQEHQRFREMTVEKASVPELVIRNYHATFDHCTANGQVHFKDLEEFVDAIYERIRIIMLAHFPLCTSGRQSNFQGHNMSKSAVKKLKHYQERLRAFLLSCVDHVLVKKSIVNRLELYALTPPSRNVFVLHGVENTTVTALIGAFTSGLLKKETPKYRIAFHTTHSSLLSDEPTDLRDVICNIILQLFPDHEVYRRAIGEVDIVRLQQLFSDILTEKLKPVDVLTETVGNGGGEGEKTITVVVVDGLDFVLPPVMPCMALRTSEETGKDTWDTQTPPLSSSSPPQQQQQDGPFSFIPLCLSRNMRLVLGCESNSELQLQMESRGRDSAELLSMGIMTPNDFDEMLRPTVLSKFGVSLSADDFLLLRRKEEALSPLYISFFVDALRSFDEAPGLETQVVVETFPGTVGETVYRVYSNLLKTFGASLIRTCSRLLMCSRWGIYESQLRSMLRLPQRRFNQLLRLMRPLLGYDTICSPCVEGRGDSHFRVCIRSRVFREFIEREDIQVEGSADDYKVWHGMLLNLYLNVMHSVIDREKTRVLFSLLITSPYERMAVKELPYHAVQAGAHHILFRLILSMPFLLLVYRNTLGYHLVRELIAAFNTLYELYEMGEYEFDGKISVDQKPTSLMRLRDYIYFLRQNNAILTEFPTLVLQKAIESSSRYPFVGNDAREYVVREVSHHIPLPMRRIVFFEVMEMRMTAKIHHGAITACRFAPRGNRITTVSVDRGLCNVSPVTCSVVAQTRQAPSRIENLLYTDTGAYHAAICYDRTILIYDSTQMKLVSRCDGGVFGAPLASVTFSARGRFYIVATEDLHLRVFETERSHLLLHVNHFQLMQVQDDDKLSLFRDRYVSVFSHKVEDEVFYVSCRNFLTMWQLTPTRDEFLRHMCFEMPFTISSGKTFLANTHLLLHPAPIPPLTKGKPAPPRLLRLCSVTDGREMAVLLSPGSQLLYQLSGDENFVATALDDGSVVVFEFPWVHLQRDDASLITVAPLVHFRAFCGSPFPVVKALRFRNNSTGLFVLGNRCEMKFWALPRRVRDHEGGDDLKPQQEEDEILDGVADGQFVFGDKDVTAWDVAHAPHADSAEIVFGDSTGCVTLLRLWSPLM